MRRIALSLGIAAGLVFATIVPVTVRAGILDHIWSSSNPPTLSDIAHAIDRIQEALVNQGTVSVKQPDVWSQGRMTMPRREFENQMVGQLTKFDAVLSARVARSDVAALSSQTALAASLTPVKDNASVMFAGDPSAVAKSVTDERNAAMNTLVKDANMPSPTFPASLASNFNLLNATAQTGATDQTKASNSGMKFGLEPNVYNDQMADYITHLQRLRRVNLGDDTADTAGYGLYLLRVPVSVQPGDKTKKGFGALVTLTMNHEFGPRFLPATYRNLVINDLVDQLGPVVHELIRNNHAQIYQDNLKKKYQELIKKIKSVYPTSLPDQSGMGDDDSGKKANRSNLESLRDQVTNSPTATPQEKNVVIQALDQAQKEVKKNEDDLLSVKLSVLTVSRTGQRSFAIAPTDIKRIYVPQNLLNLAYAAQEALDMSDVEGQPKRDRNAVRMTEVRSFLRRELESAYDLMEGRNRQEVALLSDIEYIESLADSVYGRKFEGPKGAFVDSSRELNEFYNVYESFTHRLPGNMRFRPMGVLCWAIAIEAGLLNRQLQDDMRQTRGPDGWVAPTEIAGMTFYQPEPASEVEQTFEQYVKARWPMITFALEPVVDQQNIEEALTRRRDLQLAIAFALSSGRISFRQAMTFQRQLQYEAQTIDLNQTVAAFANGNDTFGWRISPRFQLPPDESNIRAVTNLLLRGGPGPNYQLANSKIEPGMREMTAVVVMPSFVRGLRIDVASDWYRLSDPDERKVHTARAVELGRKINEAREGLDLACQGTHYRPDDVNRLRAKLHQLETMLPLQTSYVKVPYENTLGGFALFTQGASALVPELNGYEGVEYVDPNAGCDVLVYGKNFSLYESALVVGGKNVPREGTQFQVRDAANSIVLTLVSSMNPPRDLNGRILLVKQDGTALAPNSPVMDPGAYEILSREIIRLRIPPGVSRVMRADGTKTVEVFVSTPNGISNRLQIPLPPESKPAEAPRFSPIVGNPGFAVLDSTLNVRVTVQPGTTPKPVVQDFALSSRLRIIPNEPPSNPTPAAIRFVFELSDSNKVVVEVVVPGVAYDAKLNSYTLNGAQLTKLAKDLLDRLTAGGITPATNTTVNSKRIEVQPLAAPGGDIPPLIPTSNQIKVTFELVLATATATTARSTDPATTAVASARASSGRDPLTRRASTFTEAHASAAAKRAGLAGLPPLPGESTVDDSVVLTQIPPTPPSTITTTTVPAPTVIPTPAPVTIPPTPAPPVPANDPAKLVLPIPGGVVEVDGKGAGAAALAAVGGSVQMQGKVRIQRPGSTDTVEAPVTVNVPLNGANAPAAAPNPVVVAPTPTVNVAVPVTNVARQPKQGGLFHRRAPISPQNPTRPPLMERLLNRP